MTTWTDDTEAIEWLDADGLAWPLVVEWSVTGRFAPPSRVTSQQLPGQAGTQVVQVQHDERPVSFIMWAHADGPRELRESLRAYARAFDPTRGPGVLRVTAPDGLVRDLPAYVHRFTVPETLGQHSALWAQRVMVDLVAPSPYWLDADAISRTLKLAADGSPFFPWPPMTFDSSEVAGVHTIDNGGDVDAWPTWVINGPGNNITMANQTTGRLIEVVSELLVGETMTIDTRPGIKSVRGADGGNLMASLSDESALWPIKSGVNDVAVVIAGGDERTAVSVSYRRRWLSP